MSAEEARGRRRGNQEECLPADKRTIPYARLLSKATRSMTLPPSTKPEAGYRTEVSPHKKRRLTSAFPTRTTQEGTDAIASDPNLAGQQRGLRMRWGASLEGDERCPRYTRSGEAEALRLHVPGRILIAFCARGLEPGREQRPEEIA